MCEGVARFEFAESVRGVEQVEGGPLQVLYNPLVQQRRRARCIIEPSNRTTYPSEIRSTNSFGEFANTASFVKYPANNKHPMRDCLLHLHFRQKSVLYQPDSCVDIELDRDFLLPRARRKVPHAHAPATTPSLARLRITPR